MAANVCDGNCLGCSFQQQTYCAAQRTYALLKNEEALFSHISNLEEAVAALGTAFKRFGGDDQIINPFEETNAQKGDGAENRPPETINPINNVM